MEEKWCRYNTLLDAITELAIPSEKASQWLRIVCANETETLSDNELEVLEKLPLFHREFLQNKNIPPYAIKTSLARLAQKEKEAMDLWNTAALRGLLDTPSALSIIKLSLLVYPLIDLAIMRRQLCQSVIFEIKNGNLKPYFYPKSLEGKGFSDREKLQAFIELPLTEQVKATIEINELGSGLGSVHSFQYKAYALWKRYHDRARIADEPPPLHAPLNPKTYRLKQSVMTSRGATNRLFVDLFRLYGKEVNSGRDLWKFALSGSEASKQVIGEIGAEKCSTNDADVHAIFRDKERKKEWNEKAFMKAFDARTEKITN